MTDCHDVAEVVAGEAEGHAADWLARVEFIWVEDVFHEFTGVLEHLGSLAVGDKEEIEAPGCESTGTRGVEDGDVEAFAGFEVCPEGHGCEDEDEGEASEGSRGSRFI